VAFVREEAAFLAERESARLRELGSRTLELPSWRRRHKMVRVQSGNVYSVLIQVSRASIAPDAALLGRVQVSRPGVDGWWKRLASDFEITPGAYGAVGPSEEPGDRRAGLLAAVGGRLQRTINSWPTAAHRLIAASAALLAAAIVLVPATTELNYPSGCSNTIVHSPVAFFAIAIAYLALAAIPVILWQRGLAGSSPARMAILLLTLWVGLMAFSTPVGGSLSLSYLIASAWVWVPVLIVTFFGARAAPAAAPGLLRTVDVLALSYFGLLLLVSPQPQVLC
jgi:hypothetical protein